MENSKYIEFVNLHTIDIAQYVDSCFEKCKDFIRASVKRKIRQYLMPTPIHYELKFERNPYDCSGILVASGHISLDQSVLNFLENEYSGNKEATYVSGMGWSYNTYADELQYDIIELAANIMFPAIKRYIEEMFKTSLSEEDFQEIQYACGTFDDIYDNCIANTFFCVTPAIEFVGLENMSLNLLV